MALALWAGWCGAPDGGLQALASRASSRPPALAAILGSLPCPYSSGLSCLPRLEKKIGQVLTMTSNPRIMGVAFTNRPAVAAAAWAIAAAVRPKPCSREDIALVPVIDISKNINQFQWVLVRNEYPCVQSTEERRSARLDIASMGSRLS